MASIPLPHGVYLTAGRRPYQHDRHLVHHHPKASIYAVADGHGDDKTGHVVSAYAVKHLPTVFDSHGALELPSERTSAGIASAVNAIDKAAIEVSSSQRHYAGSTLCAVLRHKDTLTTVNVGDSRTILVTCSSHKSVSKQLSRDHDCLDIRERERIVKAGGVIVGNLLNGHISMSRALGDNELKKDRNTTEFSFHGNRPYAADLFINDPDVTHHQIDSNDAFIVVATDGVWKRLSNDTVTKVICKQILSGKSLEDAAKAVTDLARVKGTTDNTTIIIALLSDLDSVRSMLSRKRRNFKHLMMKQGSTKTTPPSVINSSRVYDGANGSLDSVDNVAESLSSLKLLRTPVSTGSSGRKPERESATAAVSVTNDVLSKDRNGEGRLRKWSSRALSTFSSTT